MSSSQRTKYLRMIDPKRTRGGQEKTSIAPNLGFSTEEDRPRKKNYSLKARRKNQGVDIVSEESLKNTFKTIESELTKGKQYLSLSQKIKLERIQKKYFSNPDSTIEEMEIESSGKSKKSLYNLGNRFAYENKIVEVDEEDYEDKENCEIKFENFKNILNNLKIENVGDSTVQPKPRNSKRTKKKKSKKYSLKMIKNLLSKKDTFARRLSTKNESKAGERYNNVDKKRFGSNDSLASREKRGSKKRKYFEQGSYFSKRKNSKNKRASLRRVDERGESLSLVRKSRASWKLFRSQDKQTVTSITDGIRPKKLFIEESVVKGSSTSRGKHGKGKVRLVNKKGEIESYFKSYFTDRKKLRIKPNKSCGSNKKLSGGNLKIDSRRNSKAENPKKQNESKLKRIIKSSKKSYEENANHGDIKKISKKRCSLRRTKEKSFHSNIKKIVTHADEILFKSRRNLGGAQVGYKIKSQSPNPSSKAEFKKSPMIRKNRRTHNGSTTQSRKVMAMSVCNQTVDGNSPNLLGKKDSFISQIEKNNSLLKSVRSIRSSSPQHHEPKKQENETIVLLQETLKNQNNFIKTLMSKLEGIEDLKGIKEQNNLLRDENRLLKMRLLNKEDKVSNTSVELVHGESRDTSDKKFEGLK